MFGAVCFHSSLTKELSERLELQQKSNLVILLGSHYQNYEKSLDTLSLPRLDTLREEACIKWALKAQTNPKHTHLFPLIQSNKDTRWKKKFLEYHCENARYYNSAIPYMTRALNECDSRK